MICRNCGTEIADKALICYRCGIATTEARYKPPPARSRRSRFGVTFVVLAIVLAAILVLLLGDRLDLL